MSIFPYHLGIRRRPFIGPLAAIWTIVFLFFRPGIPGEIFTRQLFAVFAFLSIILITFAGRITFSFSLKRVTAIFWFSVCIGYLLIQGLLRGGSSSMILNSCSVILLAILLISFVYHFVSFQKIIKAFILFHSILSLSALATLLLLVILRDHSQIPILLNIDLYGGESHILLIPFTFVWSRVTLFDLGVPRFLGIYREPGVAQIFFTTALFISIFIKMRYIKIIRTVLFLGSLLTFSTAYFLSLSLGILAYLIFNSKKIFSPVGLVLVFLIGILCFIFIANPTKLNLGFAAKMGESSGRDRILAYVYHMDKFKQKPLTGFGYLNDAKKDAMGKMDFGGSDKQTLGLPGIISQIGIVGALLYFSGWLLCLYLFSSPRLFCIYVPCLITLLTSQANWTDLFTWFLLLAPMRDLLIQRNSYQNRDVQRDYYSQVYPQRYCIQELI